LATGLSLFVNLLQNPPEVRGRVFAQVRPGAGTATEGRPPRARSVRSEPRRAGPRQGESPSQRAPVHLRFDFRRAVPPSRREVTATARPEDVLALVAAARPESSSDAVVALAAAEQSVCIRALPRPQPPTTLTCDKTAYPSTLQYFDLHDSICSAKRSSCPSNSSKTSLDFQRSVVVDTRT